MKCHILKTTLKYVNIKTLKSVKSVFFFRHFYVPGFKFNNQIQICFLFYEYDSI